MAEDKDVSLEHLERLIQLDESLRKKNEFDTDETAEVSPTERLLIHLRTLHAAEQIPAVQVREEGVPERIGRYQVQHLVGTGGFAVVYLAKDAELQRDVAVKIPLPSRLLNPEIRKRFVQEAQLAAQLDHPHIVDIYETGVDGMVPFIAYAYCSGPTLSAWLQKYGPLAPDLAAATLVRLTDAVAYSHQRGILHRDIKPANVLLFPTQWAHEDGLPFLPRLADFGLAKMIESATSETGSSVILGTPLYMAPEQIESASPNHSADVYGLGCILFETLTGQPPISGQTIFQVLEEIRKRNIPAPRAINPRIPKDLSAICQCAMAPVPEYRYACAIDLRDDLLRYLRRERIFARTSGFDLLVRFLRSPRRVQEAAIFNMFSNAAVLIWIYTWLVGAGLEAPVMNGATLEQLIPYTNGPTAYHATMLGLGWQIGRRKQWAAVVSIGVSGLMNLFLIATLSRWISPPYPGIYLSERTRDIAFFLVLSITGMQCLLSSCAWYALNPSRRQTHSPLS